MAVPFPTGWDPSTDGFGPLYEGDAPGSIRKALRRSQRPKRKSFVVYWTGVLLKASFVMATSIGLWKLTTMFMLWVHPWP